METMPSPTRAMIVSSPAPPTSRSMLVRTVTRETAMTWMPSLATAAMRGVSITFGFTDICTASSTSRPARSMAVARLNGHRDVGLVRRDQGVDDADDVAAGQVVGLQVVDGDVEPRLDRADAGGDDRAGRHASQAHPDEGEEPDIRPRGEGGDPEPNGNQVEDDDQRRHDQDEEREDSEGSGLNADHGSVLSAKAAHDDPVAVHPDDRERLAGVDELAVGDDIDPLALDVGDPGRPQRRRRRAALAEPGAIRLRRGGVALVRRQLGLQDEPAAERAGAGARAARPGPPRWPAAATPPPAPTAVITTAHVAPAPTRLSRQAADEGGEPEDPGDPEARRDEDLNGQEDEADADEQQLLPARQPDQPVTPEEEREAGDAERRRAPRSRGSGSPR